MPPPQSAPGDSPGGWAPDDPGSDSGAESPPPLGPQAWRGESSDSSDSDFGNGSDWHDDDPPVMAPCSAFREDSGGPGTLGVDVPRREEVAGGQRGL
eukprot:2455079-Lingulodinium_polyedra.AAC.1